MTSVLGAVMVADIIGFTTLTEELSRKGPWGVELLTRCMNAVFKRIIDSVHAHGGDVMCFAGDSVICLFLEDRGTDPEADGSQSMAQTPAHADGSLLNATVRALQCAVKLADELGALSQAIPSPRIPLYICWT